MSSGFFNIGVGALNAAQAGLVTTGHNIANANTTGYHRQVVSQSAAPPLFTGGGFLGQGVSVDTVRRVYSEFLDGQVARAQAQASYYAAFHGEVARIDNLLADPTSGLTPALQEFFAGVQDVASHPANTASRQTLISNGAALMSRFHLLDGRLTSLRESVNSQLTTTVASINSYARQIADLNGRIIVAQVNPDQPPNDLLDRRDALVESLNQLVGASVIRQGDGSYNVFVGNGQSLVLGRQSFDLAALQSVDDQRDLDIAYVSGATTARLSPSSFPDGTLGGLLAFRTGALAEAHNALGRIALSFAHTFNDQHRLGQDLSGAAGQNFFNAPQPVVTPRATNTGSGSVGVAVTSVSALTTSDYRLAYSGGSYQLTRLSDGVTTTYATLPQTVDGMTISLAAGTPANGDSFLIQPTRLAAGQIQQLVMDTARVAAAAPVRTGTGTGNTGSATVSAGIVNPPPPPDVNVLQPVTITFTSPTTFDVTGTGTGNPTGVAYVPGSSISYNGWTVSISGVPAPGDTFSVSANTGGIADGRNALLLAGLQTANLIANGTASYQGAYGQMVSLVGNKTHETEVGELAHQNILTQARETQQGLSGVNLDEEAANLLRYQQAYQAAGKMIQIGATLFSTVLDLTG